MSLPWQICCNLWFVVVGAAWLWDTILLKLTCNNKTEVHYRCVQGILEVIKVKLPCFTLFESYQFDNQK